MVDAPATAVTFENVSLSYPHPGLRMEIPKGSSLVAGRSPRLEVLRDVSFALREGEFVSLIGPSGCGKSTLLGLIAGLEQPTSGTVTVDSRDAVGRPALAAVFQEPALMPWATALENVLLPLELQTRVRWGARRAALALHKDRCREALATYGLSGFENFYPAQLSGGMRMRVSLARAMVTKPRILLLDEPFAALDEITRGRLVLELARLWHEKRWTTVFVTHNVRDAVFLSNRVLVLSQRPTHVVRELHVPSPGQIDGTTDLEKITAPRDRNFETSAAFLEVCQAASETLALGVAP